jgi:hypothetical protein
VITQNFGPAGKITPVGSPRGYRHKTDHRGKECREDSAAQTHSKGEGAMRTFETKDGVSIPYKDWAPKEPSATFFDHGSASTLSPCLGLLLEILLHEATEPSAAVFEVHEADSQKTEGMQGSVLEKSVMAGQRN